MPVGTSFFAAAAVADVDEMIVAVAAADPDSLHSERDALRFVEESFRFEEAMDPATARSWLQMGKMRYQFDYQSSLTVWSLLLLLLLLLLLWMCLLLLLLHLHLLHHLWRTCHVWDPLHVEVHLWLL